MSIEKARYTRETSAEMSGLSHYPQPHLIVPDLTVELFERLHTERGINFAVVDLDNTLVDALPNATGEYDMDEAAFQALRQARSKGFLKKYLLLSNIQIALPYLKQRVKYFAQLLDTDLYHAATWPHGKPHPRALQIAFQMMGSGAAETVIIGDQLSKDIRAARGAGAYSILRYPHFGRDPIFRKKKRWREQKIIENYSHSVNSFPQKEDK